MTNIDDNELLDRFARKMSAIETQVADPPQWVAPNRRLALPIGATRFQPMFSATKFVVAGAIVALFGGFLLLAQPFDRQAALPGAATGDAGTFSPTGSLAQPRAGHTATLLPDGRVLVVGGFVGGLNDDVSTATAEVWDPDSGTFGPTGSLAEIRGRHSATLLPDGRVLVVSGGGEYSVSTSAEIWDPGSGTFTPAGSFAMQGSFYSAGPDHSATLLPDGSVLVVVRGDENEEKDPVSAEVWDPATSTFSPAGSLLAELGSGTALADGRVLVIYYIDEEGRLSIRDLLGEDPFLAEVWDPVTDTFSPAGSPGLSWFDSATLLADGRVLFLGGHSTSDETMASAEVWDPATSTFSPSGSFPGAYGGASTVTALADGRALIVPTHTEFTTDIERGGCSETQSCVAFADVAQVWEPDTETFVTAGSPSVIRNEHTATLLPDGRVLVVGGFGESVGTTCGFDDCVVVVLDSAEVWEPSGG